MIKTKIGITGCSGLLGKILIKILKKKKLKVSCYKKDIRNIKDIKKWFNKNKDINIVFHLAAIVPLDKVDKDKKKSIHVNLDGTKNLYHSISEQNRKIWFFFASTSHVYKPKNSLLTEKDKTLPSTFYGKTKLMAENFLLKNKNNKMTICIGRIFNIFHKNQKIPFFYPSMIARYKKNKNISNKKLNLKTGNSIRDFTNAEKIAEIIFKLSKKKVGGIFNIGSGKKITLLKFIRKHINNKVEIKEIVKGDMIVANINKIKKLSII